MRILGCNPARSGPKGLFHKNLRPIAGVPLTVFGRGIRNQDQEYPSTRLPDAPRVAASRQDQRIIIAPRFGRSTLDARRIVFGRMAELLGDHLQAGRK